MVVDRNGNLPMITCPWLPRSRSTVAHGCEAGSLAYFLSGATWMQDDSIRFWAFGERLPGLPWWYEVQALAHRLHLHELAFREVSI